MIKLQHEEIHLKKIPLEKNRTQNSVNKIKSFAEKITHGTNLKRPNSIEKKYTVINTT